MVEGNKLTHPALGAGNRARMKVLPIDPREDISLDIIRAVFDEALKLYKGK